MMEEDTERITLNLNSKRRSKRRSSSILKTTAGPLHDIDPNKQDGCTVPLKKSRPSLSRRVSFAKILEVKEFPRDSPRRWEDSPAQEPAAETGNDPVLVSAPVSKVPEDQHEGSQVPVLPCAFAPQVGNEFDKNTNYLSGQLTQNEVMISGSSGAVDSQQTQQRSQESKIDGSSLLKSLVGTSAPTRGEKGLEYHTQVQKESSLGSKVGGMDRKVDGMALLQALGGGSSNISTESELMSTYKLKESFTDLTNKTSLFSESEFMDQSKTASCHRQLVEAEACLKGLRERTPLMALNNEAASDVRYAVPNEDQDDKTIVFSLGDDMQQTEVLPTELQINSHPSGGEVSGASGPMNRQSLLQSLGGSDEIDSPKELFAKKFETSNTNIVKTPQIQDNRNTPLIIEGSQWKEYDIAHQREPTIMFQQGLEMEETKVLHVPIDMPGTLPCTDEPENRTVQFYHGSDSEEIKTTENHIFRQVEQKSANKTQIFQDGADMEQTEVISNNILSNRSTLQQSGNKTQIFQDGADMEQTGVLTNNILSNRSTLQQSGSKTQIFQDGADMEQTEVISNNILSNRSTLQQSGSKTQIFQDGADMEQTEVISNNILSNRSTLQQSGNKTQIFQDGADMEQTGVLTNNILSNRSTLQQSGSKTQIFQDGADMEQTEVISNNILSNRSTLQQSGSKTQIFQDGADMEQTGVLTNNILSNRSTLQQSGNKTQIFQDGVDMEQTGVLMNNILSNRSTLQQSGSKTQIFQDGADMEQTEVISNNILSNRSTLQQSGSKTQLFQDGADMEQTGVLTNNILSNRSTLQQSGSKTQIFQDGADMEQTEVISNNILSNRSTLQQSGSKTQLFHDGADMEQTEVISNNILSNRSTLQQSGNKTQIFQDGADMEQTGVLTNNILSNRSTLQQSGSKTQIFHDGADMEQTRSLESNIVRSSMNIPFKVAASVDPSSEVDNKTVVFHDGVDMDETRAATSNIDLYRQIGDQISQSGSNLAQGNIKTKSSLTTSARLKRLSARFSSGGDNVTGRLSLGGDILTTRVIMNAESDMDGDKTPSIARNTIRLAGPTPRKGEEKICDVALEGRKADVSILFKNDGGSDLQNVTDHSGPNLQMITDNGTHLPKVTGNSVSDFPQTIAQVTEFPSQNNDMKTEEPDGQPVVDTVLSLCEANVGITEILPPVDLDIADMLPPDDLIMSTLHTSTTTDLPALKKTRNGLVERKDSSGSDSSHSQSVTSYSLVSNYSNYSMTESMLESTRREVDGPLTVKKVCLLLDIPSFRWLEFHVITDRCSILPGEQVDTSDLRNVLKACAVQSPFYLVHFHIYTQAVRQSDLKRDKAEELDNLFTQEESKPNLFKAVEQSTEQQRKILREKVLACSKVSSLLGKTEWKNVQMQATVQYRETLQDQYSRLQSQSSDVSTALQQSRGLLTALDTVLSDLDAESANLEDSKLPSEEEIQQWNLAQQEFSVKEADLKHQEEEQTKLASERDNIHSELAILKDRDHLLVNELRQDAKQVLENLKFEKSEVREDLDWMKRCLEWRPDRCEKEAVSYLFYDDSLLLETTLDTSHHRRLQSAKLTSTLTDLPSKPISHFADKSKEIMALMHRLIIHSIKEQNILTKYIGTPLEEQYKFLRAVSMVVCTGRSLAQEITRIEFNNWMTIQEQGLSVEFWCEEAGRKIDVDFDLKLKYRDYSVSPTVRVDIGKFRPEDVLRQMSVVPHMGTRYFERLCKTIDLNDTTVVPETDCCS